MAANINMANCNASAVVTAINHSPSSSNESHHQMRVDSPSWIGIAPQEPDPVVAIPLTHSSSSSPLSLTAVIETHVAMAGEEESDENADTGINGNVGKRPAWSQPFNGSTENTDSPLRSFYGSSASPSAVSVFQGSGSVPSSTTQTPDSNNANAKLTQNHIDPRYQRPMRRNSDHSASNGGLSQPLPQGLVVGPPINIDHPHQRGDGSHHQTFGGRRNQDFGNREWNGRSFNSRTGHMQPRVAHGLMMRPFGTPMGYPEFTSVYVVSAGPPESFRGTPFVAPNIPVFFPGPELHDCQLHARIMNQIDYYFSNRNLIKDTYLRQNMDEQGWVPIKLIAGFKKVSLLTDNIQLIKDALQSSTVVEVQGDKVRRRIDWMRWIMPSVQFHNMTGQDALVARFENISMEQRTANRTEGTTVNVQGGQASNSN